MRRALIAVLLLGACSAGDDDVDYQVPPDPFAGQYDSPDDFPRNGCVPGSVGAYFPRAGVWNTRSLRTAVIDGQLRTYTVDFLDEIEVPNTLTADDLLLRTASFNPQRGQWEARSYDICHVRDDGTLVGWFAICTEDAPFGPPCRAYELVAQRLTRAPGEPEASGLSKVGELRFEHEVSNVRVSDGVAFLPMFGHGMRIVSVANPEAPSAIGWWVPAQDNWYNDVKLMTVNGRRYAVLAGSPSDVIDVTDPTAPFLAATLAAYAHTLFIEGTTAYLVGGFTIELYDLSTPTAPRLLSSLEDDFVSNAHDLYVADGIAYISEPFVGLTLVDARDRERPSVAEVAFEGDQRYWHSPWVTEVGGRKIAVHGDEGTDGRLAIVDLQPTSQTFLQELGAWTPRSNVSLHNVMALGQHAYLAHYQDGIRVLDLSDPTTPTVVAHYNTWREDDASAAFYSGAFGLDVDPANRRIYVADSHRGLLILEGAGDLFPR